MITTELEIDKKISSFLKLYDVGQVQQITRLSGNFQSVSFIATTKQNQYLIKLYSSIWSKCAITEDLKLLRFHANLSAKHPLPMYQNDGSLVDTSIFNSPCVLLNIPIHGQPSIHYTKENIQSVGNSTGGFHLTSELFDTFSPPHFHWRNILIAIENTLPIVDKDPFGIHGAYIELSHRLKHISTLGLTQSKCINCIEKDHYLFHGDVLSEVTDFLFIYDLPILLDVSYQLLQLSFSLDGQIDEELMNAYISAFHAKYPLPQSDWEHLPEFITTSALLRFLLLALKQKLSHDDPLIDQKLIQAKKSYQILSKIRIEVR